MTSAVQHCTSIRTICLHDTNTVTSTWSEIDQKRVAARLLSWSSQRWYVQRNFRRTIILLMCTWLLLISHSPTPPLSHVTRPTPHKAHTVCREKIATLLNPSITQEQYFNGHTAFSCEHTSPYLHLPLRLSLSPRPSWSLLRPSATSKLLEKSGNDT